VAAPALESPTLAAVHCGCGAQVCRRFERVALAARIARQATRLVGPRAVSFVTRTLYNMGDGGRRFSRRLENRAQHVGVVNARYKGLRVALDLRDRVQREVFYFGDYEAALGVLLLSELKPGDVFVDVGAHIGVHALRAAERVGEGGRVFAFEPAFDTAAVLEEAAARNGMQARLTVVRTALGDVCGRAILHAPPDSETGDVSIRSLHATGLAVGEVPVVRFDDWADANRLQRLDVVKIDVEGHEVGVLRGMRQSILYFKPRLLVLEVVSGHLARAGESPSTLEALLAGLGYAADGPTIRDIAEGPTDALWPNAVMRPRAA
jgi:FkbM family methyltransferase